MSFNPIELMDIENSKSQTDDNEYEMDHWNNVDSQQSNFVTDVSLRQKIKCISSNNNIFSVFHMNARSLSKHFDEISGMLHNIGHDFTVLGFTESWLNQSTDQLYDLPGYSTYSSTRIDKLGGGLNVTDKVDSCRVLYDMSHNVPNGEFESFFVEFELL